MPTAIPALFGALSSIGGALATAGPALTAIGSGVGIASGVNNMMNQSQGARLVGGGGKPQVASPNTPGGALIAPQAQIGQASSGSGSSPVYGGSGNRYNSAQTLSTAPSLVGTGSGFNANSASGQPQKPEDGSTGL